MVWKFTLVILLGITVVGRVSAQDSVKGTDNLYDTCQAAIRSNPGDAYSPCKKYVEQAPAYETNRIQYVNRWLTAYQKVLSYTQYLRGLNSDPSATWSLYVPDMNIDLPQTSEVEGNFKIHIAGSFADTNEEEMLRKGEAVYDSPDHMIGSVLRSVLYWAANPPKEMAPIWGRPGNDDLEMTDIVTARAVRYYYDLTLAERKNPRLPTGFTAMESSLKYDASIKHVDHYAHGKDTFDDVYVANMNLEWAFSCGGLCGVGFTRNKVVVLDAKGNVLALYLDAPINSQSWVS